MTLSEQEYADSADSELFRSIKSKDWERVRTMLENDAATTKQADVYGNFPLHAALGYQAPDDIVLRILECNPEATRAHGTDDWLPLHVAAMWGSSANVMEALIRSYPPALDDTGENGIKGRTPRHFSGRFKHNKELLERPTEEWIRIVEAERS